MQESPKQLSRVAVAVTLTTCLLSAIGGTALGIVRLSGEIHIKSAWQAKGAGNWAEVIRQVDQARSPLLTLDATATPLLWYRGVAWLSSKENQQACEDFALALRDNPNHPHVLNNLGTCAELAGDHDQAVGYYERAALIAPRFDDAWLNLTAVYYNLGEFAKADSALSNVDSNSRDSRVPALRESITKKLQTAP